MFMKNAIEINKLKRTLILDLANWKQHTLNLFRYLVDLTTTIAVSESLFVYLWQLRWQWITIGVQTIVQRYYYYNAVYFNLQNGISFSHELLWQIFSIN